MSNIYNQVSNKFTIIPPLLYSGEKKVVAELKPYLQPFEVELAKRELKALLRKNSVIEWDMPYVTFNYKGHEALVNQLTYWQRIGQGEMRPTDQVLKELSQNGINELISKDSLHRARRLRYGVHNIHEYRGKFFPQLVKSLLNISGISPNSLVYDPMCGSGTTLVEALDLGHSALGSDLNPLSILISCTKCSLYGIDKEKIKDLYEDVERKINERSVTLSCVWNEKDSNYLSNWFTENAIKDLQLLVSVIKTYDGPIKEFLHVCLSNIIRSISFQKETDLRVRKELKEYSQNEGIDMFLCELESRLDQVLSFKEIDNGNNSEYSIFNCDSSQLPKLASDYVGKVDAIVTSPPYATALPYLDTDRLSLVVLGLLERSEHRKYESQMIGTREISEKQRRNEWEFYCSQKSKLPESIVTMIDTIASINHGDGIGFRRRNLPALLGKYFLGMLDAMSSARMMMKPMAPAYYVVGNNSTMLDGERFEINTPELLFDLAEVAGWKAKQITSMELISSRDVFRANRGTSEAILELENQ